MGTFVITFGVLVATVFIYEFISSFRKRRWGENYS